MVVYGGWLHMWTVNLPDRIRNERDSSSPSFHSNHLERLAFARVILGATALPGRVFAAQPLDQPLGFEAPWASPAPKTALHGQQGYTWSPCFRRFVPRKLSPIRTMYRVLEFEEYSTLQYCAASECKYEYTSCAAASAGTRSREQPPTLNTSDRGLGESCTRWSPSWPAHPRGACEAAFSSA